MAHIVIRNGSRQDERIEIECDEVTIGRSPSNMVPLDDPSVSGRHCVIHRQGGRYMLEDLGSTNGTRLNGERIQRHGLSAGDTIATGEIELLIDGDDIENHRDADIPPTIVQQPVTSAPAAPELTPAASGFQKRRSSRGTWLVLGAMIGVAVFAAFAWLVSLLVRN